MYTVVYLTPLPVTNCEVQVMQRSGRGQMYGICLMGLSKSTKTSVGTVSRRVETEPAASDIRSRHGSHWAAVVGVSIN